MGIPKGRYYFIVVPFGKIINGLVLYAYLVDIFEKLAKAYFVYF